MTPKIAVIIPYYQVEPGPIRMLESRGPSPIEPEVPLSETPLEDDRRRGRKRVLGTRPRNGSVGIGGQSETSQRTTTGARGVHQNEP